MRLVSLVGIILTLTGALVFFALDGNWGMVCLSLFIYFAFGYLLEGLGLVYLEDKKK